MQTLLNITLQPDGTPLVTSDFFSIEVKILAIRGFGNILYERYGEDILRIVEESLTQEELGL